MQHSGPGLQQALPGRSLPRRARAPALLGETFPREYPLRSRLDPQQGCSDPQQVEATSQQINAILQPSDVSLQPGYTGKTFPFDNLQLGLELSQRGEAYLHRVNEGRLRSRFDMQQGRASRRPGGAVWQQSLRQLPSGPKHSPRGMCLTKGSAHVEGRNDGIL